MAMPARSPCSDVPCYAARVVNADLSKLQTLRLKGRANLEMLAQSLGLSEAETQREVDFLLAAGLVEEKKSFFGLTAAGEKQRVDALDSERAELDNRLVKTLYEDFCAINGDFKQLVTDVQLGNLERDAAPAELSKLHARFAPLTLRIAAAIPRLSPYVERFEGALASLTGGDARYLASPLVESYHGLWFELHEELIQASGLTREGEAAAGRGA